MPMAKNDDDGASTANDGDAALSHRALQLTPVEIVVEVEHFSIVFRVPSSLERLYDLEKHRKTLCHGELPSKILNIQKSTAAELLRLPKIGLDQSAGRVGVLHDSAALFGQGCQAIQVPEEIGGPILFTPTPPLPDELSSFEIFLRPELIMEMGHQQSTIGRFGFGHFLCYAVTEARGVRC